MALFSGDKPAAEAFIKGLSSRIYVYLLCRPNGTPFYVGKGSNRRVFMHEMEARQSHPIGESNPFKCNVIRSLDRKGLQIIYQIDSHFERDQEQECLDRESELITKYKRLHEGGCLTNLAARGGSASGPAPYSLNKHASTLSGKPDQNPERAVLNLFLQAIGPVKSVPIKPIRQIVRILPSTPHTQPRKPTLRNAYALIASASAHGIKLASPSQIPRKFVYEGVVGIIENGVSRDILKAGMATLIPSAIPEDEAFLLNVDQLNLIRQLYGATNLQHRGLLA